MDALPDGRRVIHFDDDGFFAQGVEWHCFAKMKLEIRADVPRLDQQWIRSLYFEYDTLRKVWISIIFCLNINPYQFDFTPTLQLNILQLDSPTPKNGATLQLSPFYIHFWFVERWCCRDSVTGWSRMAGASVSLDLPSGVLCVSSTREQGKRDTIMSTELAFLLTTRLIVISLHTGCRWQPSMTACTMHVSCHKKHKMVWVFRVRVRHK